MSSNEFINNFYGAVRKAIKVFKMFGGAGELKECFDIYGAMGAAEQCCHSLAMEAGRLRLGVIKIAPWWKWVRREFKDERTQPTFSNNSTEFVCLL